MSRNDWLKLTAALALALVFVAGCAPGDARWAPETQNRANFWAGLWHGIIIIVTFIVSLFTRDVRIYEVNNVGWGYDIGFILGCMMSLGGGLRAGTHRKRRRHNWDEVGRKVAEGVREGLSSWSTEQRKREEQADWEELGRRIEERVRAEVNKWKD